MINTLPNIQKPARKARKRMQPSAESWQSFKQIYSLRDEPGLAGFLQQHPHLITVLLDAYPHIERYFGKRAQVFLDVYSDPELPGEQILASIVTTYAAPEALSLLEQFDREWLLPHFDHLDNLVTIHLEAA